MAQQVFISYSTKDAPVAKGICDALEHAGIGCWIAPRDIVSGTEWGASIIAGINAARAAILPPCNRGRSYVGWQWELTPEFGGRVDVPAVSPR